MDGIVPIPIGRGLVMNGSKMRVNTERGRRGIHRSRLLTRLLAALSVGGIGMSGLAEAKADEARQAIYLADRLPSEVALVSGSSPVEEPSILRTHLLQDPTRTFDLEIPSSSDVEVLGDSFLGDTEPGVPLAEDVDAVIDGLMPPAVVVPPVPAAPAAPAVPPPPPMVRSTASASLGAVAGAYSSAPAMIGDFFGSTLGIDSVHEHTIALAGGDRRFKVAENTSPVPQDRVFFNYNHFHDALRDVNEAARNLDRFTFGLEKTFWCGMGSIETRLPFAGGLDSRQTFGDLDTGSVELGNLASTLKFRLLSGNNWLLSGGTTMTVPTGEDFRLFSGNAPQLIVENDAVHLAPFLGYLRTSGRGFFQAFIQTDFDLNGNDVFSNGNFEGVVQDQNLLFLDVGVGRWLRRCYDPCDGFRGVAAIAELHYTTTMNDTDTVSSVSNPFNRMDLLNATGALHIQRGPTALRVGGAAPLRDDEERMFEAEILVQLTRLY